MEFSRKVDLKSLLERQDGDITIVCKDGEIKAHRLILTYRSKYFDKAFSSWTNENKNNRIALNYDLRIIKILVYYIYTGKINLIESKEAKSVDHDLAELFSLCQMICFDELCDFIIDVIVCMIDKEDSSGFKTFKLIKSQLTKDQLITASLSLGNYMRKYRIEDGHHCEECCKCGSVHSLAKCHARRLKVRCILELLYDDLTTKVLFLMCLNMKTYRKEDIGLEL